jgi:sec-independent protein translocase protein TatB
MSGIGFWELIILFLIGLIVLGPERLPRVANQLGSWLGQARRMTRVMKRQLEEELDLDNQFKIRPPTPAIPKNEDDDTYSPAHDAESPGTGVGDDDTDDEGDDPAARDDEAGPGEAPVETDETEKESP